MLKKNILPSLIKNGLKKRIEVPQLSDIITQTKGTLGQLDFELFYKNRHTGDLISPWHQIPLVADEQQSNVHHYIHEISLGDRKKMEVQTLLPHNPIKQDISKGKPRVFTYGDLPFNYGCIPQTWEDPGHSPPGMSGFLGDNDPVDVVELSNRPLELGEIYKVKLLGVIALIDQGEVDWKILGVRTDDKLASELDNIVHVGEKYPKLLEQVFHWFRYYKTSDGKPENQFGLDAKAMDVDFAKSVIRDTHNSWQQLLMNEGESQNGKLWIPTITEEQE